MVVHNDDSGRRLGYGRAENFPWMYQRTVQQPPGDEYLTQDLALTVQREQVELLDLKVSQPGAKQAQHIFRFPDSLHRRTLLPGTPGSELKGSQETSGLGGTNARRPQQLGPRPL